MIRAADCDCILLAAGGSSRMPPGKLAQPLSGEPLVRRAAAVALASCRSVIVVLGHDAERLSALLPEDPRLSRAMNEHHRDGMFGSIQCGARLVRSDWFYIVPADLPFLTAAVYEAVAAASAPAAAAAPTAAAEPARAIVPVHAGRRGHPVLVSSLLLADLLAEPRSGGPMRAFLDRYPVRRVEVPWDAILADVDTQTDLELARRRHDHDRRTTV